MLFNTISKCNTYIKCNFLKTPFFENLLDISCSLGSTREGDNIAESFLAKKFGNIGHFRKYGNKNNFFRSKNEKRVGVGNDVTCQKKFQLSITKMRRI